MKENEGEIRAGSENESRKILQSIPNKEEPKVKMQRLNEEDSAMEKELINEYLSTVRKNILEEPKGTEQGAHITDENNSNVKNLYQENKE